MTTPEETPGSVKPSNHQEEVEPDPKVVAWWVRTIAIIIGVLIMAVVLAGLLIPFDH